MARPKIVRTAEEAAAVPLDRAVQVEVVWPPPAEQMHEALEKLRQAEKQTIRVAEEELAQAEQLVLAKKDQLRRLTHGGYRFETFKAWLG
jgi:hypothetical protein